MRTHILAAATCLLVVFPPAAGAIGYIGSTVLAAQTPQQQDEFVPIDQLPPQDQLPAAPLLVAAYSFVALALFAYVVSVAKRLTKVQRDLERLDSDIKRRT